MIQGISILGVAERFEAVVAAAYDARVVLPLEFAPSLRQDTWETLHQGMGTAHSVVDRSPAAGQAWAREVSPWFSALGALVFWCLLPLLGRRRAPSKKE